jgi:hypothetical protein
MANAICDSISPPWQKTILLNRSTLAFALPVTIHRFCRMAIDNKKHATQELYRERVTQSWKQEQMVMPHV